MSHRFPSVIARVCRVLVLGSAAIAVGMNTADAQTAETLVPVDLDQYVRVRLTTDVDALSPSQRDVVALLIEAGDEMNECFWYESYGDRQRLLERIEDPETRRYAEINYGPWDRLRGNRPFVDGFGPKPPGANFYPHDMTREEFESSPLPAKADPYTFVRRSASGDLQTVPYHEQFSEIVGRVSRRLVAAAERTENAGLRRYLRLRAEALQRDDYRASDMAWLDMKDNTIDVVIGPIENYEDQLFGYKTAHEAYVLVKDRQWSQRLAKYSQYLPKLQRQLPVPDTYKSETPGTDTELNAYDVVFYAGDCNSGSKTIAINLPNDETVQLEKGTRRLQLKNAMRAKFDKILLPIADELIDPEERSHVTFDAFFANTMFHEVAHGLGIKNTITDGVAVRTALRQHASAIEEGKADILGLNMILQLHDDGQWEGDPMDHYVTFLAGIFRSVRFGTSSAHGKANMIRFRFFQDAGAFETTADGKYRVNAEAMRKATRELSALLLTIQGDGDYERAGRLIAEKGVIADDLQTRLDQLSEAGIPVDVVFEQGLSVLGLPMPPAAEATTE